MPIGVRIGPRVGPRIGLRIGSGVSGVDPMAGVARDATSGIYCPANASQWNTALAASSIGSGGPSLLWLGQEAAGNLADAIGTFTGTVTGTPTYQTPVTGWSRFGITFADASTARFVNADVGLPDVNVASMLVYAICKYPNANPAAVRNIIEVGTAGANRGAAELNTTGVNRAFCSGNTQLGSTNQADNGVHPLVLRVNQTADTFTVFNGADKFSPVFAAGITGKALNIGGVAAGQAMMGGGYLYVTAFFTGAAELTDAQVKTLLQTLGWSIAWS